MSRTKQVGAVARKPMPPSSTRQKLWRSMRVLTRKQGGFTYAELCVSADASLSNVRRYISGLVRNGYVSRARAATGKEHVGIYSLLRDTGPHAARLRHDQTIFDPNLEVKSESQVKREGKR